jgi:hypothetical protein
VACASGSVLRSRFSDDRRCLLRDADKNAVYPS